MVTLAGYTFLSRHLVSAVFDVFGVITNENEKRTCPVLKATISKYLILGFTCHKQAIYCRTKSVTHIFLTSLKSESHSKEEHDLVILTCRYLNQGQSH